MVPSKKALAAALLFAPIALLLSCGAEEISNVPEWMTTEIQEWTSDHEIVTIGDTVKFSIVRLGGSLYAVDQCHWAFGDGTKTVDEKCNVTRHAYENAGVYEVAVELINEYGAECKRKRFVKVLQGKPEVNAGDSAVKCFVNSPCAFDGTAEDPNEGAETGPGKIVSYWWDYDGDGKFDDSSATNDFSSLFSDSVFKAEQKRKSPRRAVFCAEDDDRNRVCDTVDVEILNRPPEAAGPLSALKDTISFLDTAKVTPPEISDPDGNLIDSLWWDFDEDGEMDEVTALGASVVAVFPDSNGGTYSISARAKDVHGAITILEIAIVVIGNHAPVAEGELAARRDTISFLDTLTLIPPAFTDPDGNLVDSLWWDLDGDGTIDMVTPMGVSVVDSFPSPAGGTYTVTVTAKDALGAPTTISKTIVVSANQAPVASGTLQASKTTPSFLDTLTLTPPAFADPDGNLVDSLWWDLDGDGTTDKVTPMGTSVVDSFPNPAGGTYTISVTSKDALSATTTISKTFVVPANRAPTMSGKIVAVDFGNGIELIPDSLSLYDFDGNLVDSLWWDLDGDDIFETAKNIAENVSISSPESSSTFIKVRGKDLYGAFSNVVIGPTCGTTPYSLAKQFCDTRDNRIYKWVAIGKQTWMAENLNYADSIATPSLVGDNWCYGRMADHCARYGRLYSWQAAMDSVVTGCGYGATCTAESGTVRGICPNGWHLPNSAEWDTLAVAVGSRVAGQLLKSSDGWCDGQGNGEDAYGFSALPSGRALRYGREKERSVYFSALDSAASFWTSNAHRDGESGLVVEGDYKYMVCGSAALGRSESGLTWTDGRAIRCVKD